MIACQVGAPSNVALGQQLVCPDAAIVAKPRDQGETVLVVEDDTTVRLSSPVGLFLGTVVEVGGGWQTSRVIAGGQLRTQRFAGRDATARWLASIAPQHGK